MKTSDIIVILGASDNPNRPSCMAGKLLKNKGYTTLNVMDQVIQNEPVETRTDNVISDKDKTVTIFLKPKQQKKYYNYVLSLKPSRIIFNPGTENDELIELASKNNIKVLNGCTIAMVMNSIL